MTLVAAAPQCFELVLKVGGLFKPTDLANDGRSTCNLFKILTLYPTLLTNIRSLLVGSEGILLQLGSVYEKVFKVNLSNEAPCFFCFSGHN